MPQGQRQFLLSCAEHLKLATYARLYAEWLFSGGAPTSLAKLHRHADDSTGVSFSRKVRACIYILRLYQQRGYPFVRACNQIASIFAEEECSIEVSQESWQNVVLRSEHVEATSNIWEHAYPTPALPESSLPPSPEGPSTVVQTEPFRGVVSLLPSEPNNVPESWTLWTPVTMPETQQAARRKIYRDQCLQNLESVNTKAANPIHERHIYHATIAEHKKNAAKKIRFFSPSPSPNPDAITGAEEEFAMD